MYKSSRKRSLLFRLPWLRDQSMDNYPKHRAEKPSSIHAEKPVHISQPILDSTSLVMGADESEVLRNDHSFYPKHSLHRSVVEKKKEKEKEVPVTESFEEIVQNEVQNTIQLNVETTSASEFDPTISETATFKGMSFNRCKSLPDIPPPKIANQPVPHEFQIPDITCSTTSIDRLQLIFNEKHSSSDQLDSTVHAYNLDSMSSANLSSANLSSANLSSANLSSANPSSADMSLPSLTKDSSPDQTTIHSVKDADEVLEEDEFVFDDSVSHDHVPWTQRGNITPPTEEEEKPQEFRVISMWRPEVLYTRAANTPDSKVSRSGSVTSNQSSEFRTIKQIDTRIKYLESRAKSNWPNIITGLPRFLPINQNYLNQH